MKVAIVFHRLGPYHFARLRAAGRELPITAIETSGEDTTYAWEKIAGADGFERIMLFANADAQRQSNREVQVVMASTLDKIRPGVVVVPGWADAAALSTLAWSIGHGVPAVCMSESTEWDFKRRAWSEGVKRRIAGLFASCLAGGHPHRDYVTQLGIPSSRVFLGYDAVDNGYFAEGAEEARGQKAEGRRQHGLPERYFLASARFIEKKNLPRLIQAYARYRNLCPTKVSDAPSSVLRPPSSAPWSLVLLGDGPLRADLCHLIADLSLQEHVHLPGFKQYPDLPAYYGLASGFIHASTTEQWGLVVNEAMASGLPVLVSSRCGCATDLVKDGVNGFTFDPCNVVEMAKLMVRVASMERGAFSPGTPPASGAVFRVSAEKPRGFAEGGEPDSRGGCAPQLSTTLAEMGAASCRIISDWGPDRFALGLKSAVEKAIEVGPVKPTIASRALLKTLLWLR